MANVIIRENLGEQHPSEVVQYTFDLKQNSAFVGTSAETLDENAVWRVVKSDALTTDLSSTMVNASAYNNTLKTISVEIQAGVDGSTYYVAGLVTVASDRKYIVIGKLKFENKLISVAFS